MQVTATKAVAPLLVAAIIGLIGYFFEGGDIAAFLVPLTGIATFGVVYILRWADTRYDKTIAAAVVPLAVMVVSILETGQYGNSEIFLTIQAALGAAATYISPRVSPVAAPPPTSGPTG